MRKPLKFVHTVATAVLVGGLLLMGMKTFNSAGWVWAKAMIGLLLAKGVLTLVDPAAREIAAVVGAGAAGDPARLAELVRMEWGGLWVALALVAAAANGAE
jgi:hypothetical protein